MSNEKLFYYLSLLFFATALFLILRSREANRNEFDERQQLNRFQAYKISYYTALCLCAAFSLFHSEFDWMKMVSNEIILQTILWISMGVFACTCILRESYYGLHPRPMLPVFAVYNLIVNSWYFLSAVINKELLADGMLAFPFIFLLIAMDSLAILLCLWICAIRSRGEIEG